MTLKILYHHRTQGRGAEGQHILRIVLALRELGHEVDVVSPPGIDPLANLSGIPVDRTKAKTSGLTSLWKWTSTRMPGFLFEIAEVVYNVPAFIRLSRALRAKKYDLVYERYAFYLLAGSVLARRFGVPFVLEANEVSGVELRVRKQSYPWLCNMFEHRLFESCTAIHTVSSYLKSRILAQGVASAKVFIAPNAFDVDKLPQRSRRHMLARELGVEGKSVVGFAGWFSEWDRLDFLIEVFSSVRASRPDTSLLLIGDGPMVPELREQCRALGLADHVVFTGPVARNEVYDYIDLLDVAVLAHSNRFGSPMVMFEFMGLKIPIVAPKLEPIIDVQTDRQTAMLFDPLDKGQCLEAIEALLRNPELGTRIADKAFDKLRAEHTWRRNAEHILESAGLHNG